MASAGKKVLLEGLEKKCAYHRRNEHIILPDLSKEPYVIDLFLSCRQYEEDLVSIWNITARFLGEMAITGCA